VTVRPSFIVSYTGILECAADITCWFVENWLLLSSMKTEAVLLDTAAQREKMPTADGLDARL